MQFTLSHRQHLLILDDHEIIQHGLGLRLSREPDIEVAGYCSNSHDLLALLSLRHIDIVVTDFALGPSDVDGVHLVKLIKARSPRTRILVLTAQYTAATASLVLQAGAHGFIGKSQPLSGVVAAIQAVCRGQIYLTHDMAAEVAEASDSALRARHGRSISSELLVPPGASLSPREREVLRCCLDGMSVTQIAGKFSRSINTISTQKQSAFRKLGIRSDCELFLMREMLPQA